MRNLKTLPMLIGICVVAGVLVAGLLFPLAGGFGMVSNQAADTIDNVSSELISGQVPEVTRMTDSQGNTIAMLYDQRRTQVPFNEISPDMVRSIISIEDKRFMDHDGVDWKGTLRALLKNSSSGEVQQGASTLDQQYVKNYQLLVLARTDAERRAAIETTPARKLREVRMALSLEKTLEAEAKEANPSLDDSEAKIIAKQQILARYLNLVPFGNGAFGIEQAAYTYFNKHASQLNIPESAMLAGMVQSSSGLNPYTSPKAVITRRNIVLDTLAQNYPDKAAQYLAAKKQPLGILPRPKSIPQGCISAHDNGFFCDYALQYLAENGLSAQQVSRGGYVIRTTLDPAVQKAALDAVQKFANPDLPNIAQVMNIIQPGRNSHNIMAMVSSRNYGLDTKAHETVQPQPFSLVGDGAGSTFKIFTVAAAMEKGMGIDTTLSVPRTFQAKGMGHGGYAGCPPDYYCVKNTGNYAPSMSVTQALATSPNTAFVKLIQQVGVGPTVDMAVKLGLRSYAAPGTSGYGDESLANMIKKQNLGSFTLGPTAVNPLELSNVAATLASHGTWCPPNPILSIDQHKRNKDGSIVLGKDGKAVMQPVPFSPPKCEQAVPPGLADTLANALSDDDRGSGTSAGSARAAGWDLPVSAKTGTTETSRSSAFVGFTSKFAGASYIYGDTSTPGEICSYPLRSCNSGNLFGGNEPALSWYTAMRSVANNWGPFALPPTDPKYVDGSAAGHVPDVAGLAQDQAIARVRGAGFKTDVAWVDNAAAAGTAVSTDPSGSSLPGGLVTINISTGHVPPPPKVEPRPSPSTRGSTANPPRPSPRPSPPRLP